MRDVAVSSNHSEAVNSVKREQSSYLRKNAFKDWHKDLTCKAKAKAKDMKIVLKDSLRTRPRPRTNITVI